MKRNFISNSDPIFYDDMMFKLKTTLRMNGYPEYFIRKILAHELKPPPPREISNDKYKYFSIPYVGQSSWIISKHLRSLSNNFKVAFGNYNTNKEKYFSYMKDKIPNEQKSGVIYVVPCSNCPSSYVGETCQKVKARLSQHKNDVSNQKDNTALATHALEKGHVFNFNRTKIVGSEENDKKRKILEVINIIKDENCVNFKTDTDGLSDAYKPVLKR